MPDTSRIDFDDVLNAVERSMFGTDNPGFCTDCGEESDGHEPDARGQTCNVCGAEGTVWGAEELLIIMG